MPPGRCVVGDVQMSEGSLSQAFCDAHCGRHEIYEGYKGNRQTMPSEIAAALPKLSVLLEHMRIPTFKVPPPNTHARQPPTLPSGHH